MIHSTKRQTTNDFSFEDSLQKIREVLSSLESGTLTLDESIAMYRHGTELIDRCRTLIADAEMSVAELTTKDEPDL